MGRKGESPAELKYPFIESKKTCPVCETLTLHVRLKSKLYKENGLDIDMRPKNIIWTYKGYSFPNPRLYYMRTCPVCRFTSGYSHFEEPSKHYAMTLQKFVKLLKPLLYEDERVIKVSTILASDIDIFEPDYPQAFRQHALAVYLLSFIDDLVNKDALNLARYYMRIAWLFREISMAADKAAMDRIFEIVNRVKHYWPEIPASESICLQRSIGHYETSLDSSHALSSPMEETAIKMIIARSCMLLEDMEKARHFISLGWDTVRMHEIKKKEESRRFAQGKSKLKQRDIWQMDADIKRMGRHIVETQEIYDDIWKGYEKSQIDLAESLLEKISDSSMDKKVEVLEKCGIDHRVIRMLFPQE